MHYFQLGGAGGKFTTIPKTNGRFHRHEVNGTSKQANGPTYDVINSVVIHIKEIDFIG